MCPPMPQSASSSRLHPNKQGNNLSRHHPQERLPQCTPRAHDTSRAPPTPPHPLPLHALRLPSRTSLHELRPSREIRQQRRRREGGGELEWGPEERLCPVCAIVGDALIVQPRRGFPVVVLALDLGHANRSTAQTEKNKRVRKAGGGREGGEGMTAMTRGLERGRRTSSGGKSTNERRGGSRATGATG